MTCPRLALYALFVAACGGGDHVAGPSGAGIAASSEAVSFGDVAATTSATQHVTISSTGRNALTIRAVGITGDARGTFSSGGLPVQLTPGAGAMLDVAYEAPLAAGSDSAMLVIASDADDMPQLAIALTGTSVAAPVPLTVELAGAGGGTVISSPSGIACGATCSADFTPGTVVTLTATPDGTSAFAGFTVRAPARRARRRSRRRRASPRRS